MRVKKCVRTFFETDEACPVTAAMLRNSFASEKGVFRVDSARMAAKLN